jgi:hypothetical protein
MDNAVESRLESDEGRLRAFGLSTAIFHNALRPGASRAANRSILALESSAGNDIYHDGMENLHQLLQPHGWKLSRIDLQPRLVHPEGIVSFTIASGINVQTGSMRTGRKGPATRGSLPTPDLTPSLFEDLDAELAAIAAKAPFYFLLWERILLGGNGLRLEFAQPAGMTEGGSVNAWADRIKVPDLMLEGDLSVFDRPDETDEFDVPVEPR